jgi:LPXTG-motif cell wall-anchored protein
VDSSDVTLSIPFALKTVTTTYTFVDETTGKTIDTETNTWDLTSTSGEEAFKTYGLRAPMALYTLTNSTPVLEASDDSTTPVTDTADLPYFGPDGDIFDNGYYVLDTSKSAGTPLDYSTWPTSGTIDETFYYKEATEPSVTVEAVDPSGKVLKTFSTTSFGAALPSTTVTAAADLPTAEALDLPGYTLTGVTVSGSASHSGIPDKTLTYTGTPADYSAFLTSTQGSGTYDIRQLMNDYNDATVAFQYTPNVVKLMVQPVDAQGNPIGSPIEVASGTVGSSESIKLPAVTGYEAATGFDTNITISPDQGVISVPYTKVTTEPTNPTEGNGGSGTTTPGTGSSSGSTTGSASETSTTKPGTTASSTSTSGKAPAYATRESYKAAKASLKKTASPSSLKSSGLLSGTSATGSKFPQTGNDNSMTVLSAIGLALMGTLGLCYKKIKRLL